MRQAIRMVVSVLALAVTAVGAESLLVSGGAPDVRIHLLHQAPAASSGRPPLLLLHPYGAPCAEAYDLPAFSLMKELAVDRHVYAMDFRGFGQSSKPVESSPVGRAGDAVSDVIAVIDYIRRATGTPKVALLGWSWGGVVAPMVVTVRPDLVEKIALVGAMHAFALPMMTQPFASKTEPARFAPQSLAYQKIETSKVLGHWKMMLADRKDIVDAATIEAIAALAERCSAGAPDAAPGFTVRPMGPLQDLFEIWSNRPIYDAAQVRVPVLVIRGDRDVFADKALASKLPRAKELVIPDATHWLPYEKNRTEFVRALAEFLAR